MRYRPPIERHAVFPQMFIELLGKFNCARPMSRIRRAIPQRQAVYDFLVADSNCRVALSISLFPLKSKSAPRDTQSLLFDCIDGSTRAARNCETERSNPR